MAEIIYTPSTHDCYEELKELGDVEDSRKLPLGTIARCSCGIKYKLLDSQYQGVVWDQIFGYEQ